MATCDMIPDLQEDPKTRALQFWTPIVLWSRLWSPEVDLRVSSVKGSGCYEGMGRVSLWEGHCQPWNSSCKAVSISKQDHSTIPAQFHPQEIGPWPVLYGVLGMLSGPNSCCQAIILEAPEHGHATSCVSMFTRRIPTCCSQAA